MRHTYWLLLGITFLCLVTFVSSQKLANDSDVDVEIRRIANKKNVGSISGWVAMGAGIRRSATGGTPPIEEILDSGGDFQAVATTVAGFYAGLIVLLAFSALFAFGSCIACPSFFCCRACGACGGDKPRKEGYDKNEKICAAATLGVSLILIVIGCIIGLVTNGLITQSLTETITSINETANDAQDFPSIITESLNTVIRDVNDTVDDVFEIIRNVPESIIGEDGSLSLFVTNLTDIIRSIQGQFDTIFSQGKELDSSIQALLTKLDTLAADTQTLNNQISGYSTVDRTLNAFTYRLDDVCIGFDSFTPIVVNNASGLLPPVTDFIDQLNVNLSSVADDIDSTFDTIQSNFTGLIDEQFENIRSQVGAATASASDFLLQLIQDIEGNFDQVRDYQATIDEFYQNNIIPNNEYRSIATIILFCLNLLIVVLAVVGLLVKKSPIMTSGICLAFFLMIIFWILVLIHLIIAVPVGKICDIFTNREIVELIQIASPTLYDDLNQQFQGISTTNSTIPNPLAGLDLNGVVNLVYDTLETCRDGGNLITFLNLTDFVNLDSYIDEALSQINLNETIDSIEISNNTFGDLDLTGSIDFSTLIDDLNAVKEDFNVYVNLIEALLINSTDTKAKDAKTLVDTANNIALLELCIVTNPGGATPGEINQMAVALSAELDATSALLTQIIDVSIPDIRSDITNIRSQFDNFTLATTGLADEVDEILVFISEIETELFNIINGIKDKLKSETTPQLIDTLYDLADSVEETAIGLGDCQFLGEDIYAIINSLCITTVGGLDAVWYTCGYLGLSLISVVVGIALYAKRWIRADPMDQEINDHYYKDNQDYELPPMYDNNNDDKK